MQTGGSTNINTQTQAPGEGVHRHPRQPHIQRDPDVRIHPEMRSHREGKHRDTQTRHPQTQQHTQGDTPSLRHVPPEEHTPTLEGGVCSIPGGRGSAPWSYRTTSEQRAPSAGEDFPSASLNKGPPAVSVRWSLRVRPLGLRPVTSWIRRSRLSARVPQWRCGPCASPRGASQPSPHQQFPLCSAPGAQHRASPSPLLPACPVTQ